MVHGTERGGERVERDGQRAKAADDRAKPVAERRERGGERAARGGERTERGDEPTERRDARTEAVVEPTEHDDEGTEPDPRVVRSRRRVLRAALEVLAGEGWGGFTVEKVAARAGVARSTVYRHWPDGTALIADALETLNRQPGGAEPRVPETTASGDAEPGVAELLAHLAAALTDSTVGRCLPALIEGAERDPATRAFLHGYSRRRGRALVRAIERGVAAGGLPARTDPELAAAALAGAVMYRRLMTDEPLPPERVGDLAEQVLGAGGSTAG